MRTWLAVFFSLLSIAASAEDLKQINIVDGERARFEAVAPDGVWGEAFYLYSRTGIPYRCFIQGGEPQPLACRRTAAGEETEAALAWRNQESRQPLANS